MLDYLTFIDELKKIKGNNNLIDETIKKYENMVNEFENDRERIENIWDVQENQQKLVLDN